MKISRAAAPILAALFLVVLPRCILFDNTGDHPTCRSDQECQDNINTGTPVCESVDVIRKDERCKKEWQSGPYYIREDDTCFVPYCITGKAEEQCGDVARCEDGKTCAIVRRDNRATTACVGDSALGDDAVKCNDLDDSACATGECGLVLKVHTGGSGASQEESYRCVVEDE